MPAKYEKLDRGHGRGFTYRKVLSRKKREVARRRAYVPTGKPIGPPVKHTSATRTGHHAFLRASPAPGAVTPFKKGGFKKWVY